MLTNMQGDELQTHTCAIFYHSTGSVPNAPETHASSSLLSDCFRIERLELLVKHPKTIQIRGDASGISQSHLWT